MAVKKMVTIPDPILVTKTKKVTEIDDEIRKVAQDLVDTLRVAKKPEGAGLAANQIGYPLRMCIVRDFIEDPAHPSYTVVQEFVLINPRVVAKSKVTETDWEGCLSVPNTYGEVIRPVQIKVEAQNLAGDTLRIKANDFFARTLMHEIDHLDGILFTDRVIGKTVTEEELDEIYAEK